jgi:membrane-associated phospholipid phosphatase
MISDAGIALWEGGETRIGKTAWQVADSAVITGISTEVLKLAFGRERPSQTDDPNKFFQGTSNQSFPSGEVGQVSAIVTPFVLEYRHDHPSVYALEVLPAYDMVARVKVRGHWQSDVLAGFAIGTTFGYLAHRREMPFILNLLPHGFMVGLRKTW